ncbi:DUF2889 domain-containing protein [Niveispirillum sp. KHB5.9]|uniref:DUF2889 domain-containing protein n=1 Tax=Niveispirillum sp. KHB5.9 TaxID=3400269 RepID=UPI003A89E1EB
MPLPPPDAERQPFHTRAVTCQGFMRADGLWDIEGHIKDTKSYPFERDGRTVTPGDPIHEMWIRLTLDNRLKVRAVTAVTDAAPYRLCPSITENFQRLVGLSIVSGWTAAVKERLGGVEGCTHLVELLGPVATTAFQTIAPYFDDMDKKARKVMVAKGETPPPRPRPPMLDTCHVWATDGEVVAKEWPEFAVKRG